VLPPSGEDNNSARRTASLILFCSGDVHDASRREQRTDVDSLIGGGAFITIYR